MSDVVEPATDGGVRKVVTDRYVAPLLTVSFATSMAQLLQAAVLGKQVFDITGRTIDLGLLGLAEFLPAAMLVLVTGALADRVNRKRIAIAGYAGELACALALMFYARSDPTAVWPLFAIAFAFGAFRAFAMPAERSMSPMVAPDGQLSRVIALKSSVFTAAAILGPALSGFLYDIEPWVAYATGAALMALGLGVAFLLRFRRVPAPPAPDDKPSLHHAMEGLRFIRRTPILLAAISLDLFAVLFGGAVALLPSIAEDRLHVGDVAYGWLRASAGMGAAAMAILLAFRPIRRHVGHKLLLVVFIFGAATVVLGVTHSYAIAFVSLFLLSGVDMVSVFIRSTLVPLVTPDEKRGRVLAVESVFIGASNELGAFESGVASAVVGTGLAVAGGGVITMGVAAVWGVVFPSLRDVDRFEDLEAEYGYLAPAPDERPPDDAVGAIAEASALEADRANP